MPRSSPALLATFAALASSACEPLDHDERLRRMAPVFGQPEITYVAGTDAGGMPIANVVSLSETIGVHRRLSADESELLRKLAQAKWDDFVLAEMRALKPEFERRKREVRKQIAAEPPAEREEAEREAIAEIEAEWRRSALIRVEEKYGSDLAISIRSRDRKPVVAITEVEDGEVQKPTRTFELDSEIDGDSDKIRHRGREASLIDAESDLPRDR